MARLRRLFWQIEKFRVYAIFCRVAGTRSNFTEVSSLCGWNSQPVQFNRQQFFQSFAGFVYARVFIILGHPISAGEFKIFAEVPDVLFGFRFGAAVAALVGGADVVAGAIEARRGGRRRSGGSFRCARAGRRESIPSRICGNVASWFVLLLEI